MTTVSLTLDEVFELANKTLLAKDTNINMGVLDPLGATLTKGKTLYFDLIKNISTSIKNC